MSSDDLALHDHAAEVALLSACVWSKTARQEARRHIVGSDLYQPRHEQLWEAMRTLDRAGKTVDPITLSACVGRDLGMGETLLEVTTSQATAGSASDYAAIVRSWAVRRRLREAGAQVVQRSLDSMVPPAQLAAAATRIFTGIRDHGAGEDVTALTLGELMDVPDEQPRWVIPDLLETGDRLILTGSEGAGKSALSRQLGVMAAAGLHPFTSAIMPPIKAVFVDCENKAPQVRRQTAPLLRWIRDNGQAATDPLERVVFDLPGRIDLTRDRDLGAIHRLLDAMQPDLLVIGPIYKMTNRSLNDEENASQFLVSLDSLMDRGVALIIEAHAGHSTEGMDRRSARRALRPRGSSSLLGWPEFGLGLRGLPHGIADLEPWRGGREVRSWPSRVRRTAGNRWIETYPDDAGTPEVPPEPVEHADWSLLP